MKKKTALILLKERVEFAKEHYSEEAKEYIEALQVAIDAISEQLNKWYRPEERLPNPSNPREEGLVLAVVDGYCGKTKLENAYMFAYFQPKGGWALEHFPGEKNFSVKKWMPLPDQEEE